MKYTFLVVAALVLIGALGITLISNNESDPAPEVATSTNPLAQPAATETDTDTEYTIDASDMYVVDETQTDSPVSLLTDSEERWLKLMREEEKLARDVYRTLGETWGVRIFSNIAASEQTHTDAVKTLLLRYAVTDPVTNDAVGVFTDTAMQKLYNDLTEQGSKSLLDALVVGATIEDLDINDLDTALAENSKADIAVIYQNLQKGSRNHLRAFVRQIEMQGGTYSPQYISASDYEAIISSAQEKGRI